MTPTTRRAALGALASASALALPAVTAAASPAGAHGFDPAGSLAILGAEFEEAWAAERRAYDDVDGEVGGTAYHRTSGIARAILATRATSLADFRIKARALLWCYSDDYEEMVEVLFDPAETTDVRLLRSIVADLLAPRPQTGGAAKA
jgi:hypothetical protein